MLSLHPLEGRVSRADNLLPTARGGLVVRPRAEQLLTGAVTAAASWGGAIVAERDGRIGVLAEGSWHDTAPAGLTLAVAPYAAYTAGGAREERCYIADGVSPPWFIAKRSAVYGRHDIVNSVTDADGVPYPLPTAGAIAVYAERLWVVDPATPLRLQHCQNEDPDQWDPLWTLDLRPHQADGIVALTTLGEGTLACGLRRSSWGITGTSQYNFTRVELGKTGLAGPYAHAADDDALFAASPDGLHRVGGALLSEDIEEAFTGHHGGISVALDRRRNLVLVCVLGRVFAMHRGTGRWGEIAVDDATGVFEHGSRAGWYGNDGLWLMTDYDLPDRRADGSHTAITGRFETWPQQPNAEGLGRADMPRVRMNYYARKNAALAYTGEAEEADGTATSYTETVNVTQDRPLMPQRAELNARLAGAIFTHRIDTTGHVELLDLVPQYRFREATP